MNVNYTHSSNTIYAINTVDFTIAASVTETDVNFDSMFVVGNNIYISDLGTQSIWVYNNNTLNNINIVSCNGSPKHFCMSVSGNFLYWMTNNSIGGKATSSNIFRYNISTEKSTSITISSTYTIASATEYASYMDFCVSDDDLYVYTVDNKNNLQVWTFSTGTSVNMNIGIIPSMCIYASGRCWIVGNGNTNPTSGTKKPTLIVVTGSSITNNILLSDPTGTITYLTYLSGFLYICCGYISYQSVNSSTYAVTTYNIGFPSTATYTISTGDFYSYSQNQA